MSWAQETNALRMISVVIGSAVAAGRSAVWVISRFPLPSGSRDQDVPVGVERGAVARRDDGRRALLLDDDRPLDAAPGREALAQQHRGVVRGAGEDDAAAAEQRLGVLRRGVIGAN